MESLGKEKDLQGKRRPSGNCRLRQQRVNRSHAYVQQLREGVPNFFATFIEVLKHRDSESPQVDEDGMNSGDYLHGFFLGTRDALYEKERKSITLTIKEVSPASVGALIALFERAVGLYASLVGINAYHQPGVEAGKKAAASVLEVRKAVREYLLEKRGEFLTTAQVAFETGFSDKEDWVFKILENLAVNEPQTFDREIGQLSLETRFRAL